MSATRDLPCLRVVASNLRSTKPESGELGNDIESIVDPITRKRASLSLGFFEALSFLRIMKDRMKYDAKLFCDLPNAALKDYILGLHSKLPNLPLCDFASGDNGF